MRYYHVTPVENYNSIMVNGLVPQIGDRSAGLETQPAVFLFPTEEDMDTALSSWLGNEFEDYAENELVSLEVLLPDTFVTYSDVAYEVSVTEVIPPELIRFHKYQ